MLTPRSGRLALWALLAATLTAPLPADDCNDRFHAGDLAGAEDCLQEQARLRPDQARAWYRLGLARAARGRYREAADAQRLAVGHAPALGQAYCALALDLRESNQSVEGLIAAREAVRLLPAYAGAWNLLGNLELDNGHRDASYAAYRQALSLRADYPGAWFNLGQLHERGLRIEEARDAYGRALSLKPGFGEARLGRAELALAHGPLDQAEADFTLAAKSRDWEPEGWWGLERVAKARHDAATAADCRRRYKHAVHARDQRLDRLRRAGREDLQPYEPGLPLPALNDPA
jgi:tetratricopeptide (TPR) repeat protein